MKEVLPIPEQPVHPGLILKFECECRGITVEELAVQLEYTLDDLQEVLLGNAPVIPLLALKIERLWELSAGLLISIQKDHDAVHWGSPQS
ncbi:helix-turn-helix transcriptional regulator [Deinococcus cellulosilyticus]|uniref:HTH cro/C1-type domain-containing protein n=1 Tax=Deinococcus cellulosilyticus (strain DSM 18568 / NBRC 106333 / KACC 11606 / 5516J-15) TaxID=1223518 RepID=A0A511N2Q3_DEIC1|nr:addiction module antidote protein, HigA family [Deinococcus cellulosilyticus]GEM46738.1 hypothetical protein DC3_23730 [Deinococcus cellulosilyticus NBRC 106333 = KACC 11606]